MLKRYKNNPILTRKDIPNISEKLFDFTSVFNPGAIKFNDKYILILRVQSRSRESYFIKAESDDGINFEVENKVIELKGIEKVQEKIYHCYDARITKIGDEYYIMFAMDMEGGCTLGVAKTKNFEEYQYLGKTENNDVRNGVIFPEKINGKYVRFDRPNKVKASDGGVISGNAVCLSESEDLINWQEKSLVMEGRWHYWDELIGAGPPPVKTEKGWLLIYHGIATHYQPIYQAGVALFDLDDPTKLIARGNCNILEPRDLYELVGQVPNVCFPSGMIIENFDKYGFAELDSEVKVYYGAADTVVGLATSTIKELLNSCEYIKK